MRCRIVHGHLVLSGESQKHPGLRDIAVLGTDIGLTGIFPEHEDDVTVMFVKQHQNAIREQKLRRLGYAPIDDLDV